MPSSDSRPLRPGGVISSWTRLPYQQGVSTLLLVRFPDGTQTLGNLVGDDRDVSIGAEVEHVAELAMPGGIRHLFRLREE
jgi:hypothetical protein